MATSLQDRALQLDEPLVASGVASVNFFNGRLLAGGDFLREQQARREFDQRAGLAVGDGVACGLEVERDPDLDTPNEPALRVAPGLAVNRRGQSLRLLARSSVALTRRFDAAGSADCQCSFTPCEPVVDGSYVAGAGIYILTIAPAQQAQGRAPTNGLDPNNLRCNTDALVDAPRFRLVAVSPLRYADLDVTSPRFRNRLAYRCFGIDAREAWATDPWRDDPASYGLLDELRALSGDAALTDADVPLALIYWTAQGLQFVDMWSVRRRLLGPDALAGGSFYARSRRLVEAEAMCAQFQQQLSDLLAGAADPAATVAGDHFRHLPPFGLVPLQVPPLRGFVEAAFFSGVVRRGAPGTGQLTPFIDARLLAALRRQSLDCAPTDLSEDEFLWVLRPWQNAYAALDGQFVQPLLAFASGLAPEPARARMDMARFDFSNYAHCCNG